MHATAAAAPPTVYHIPSIADARLWMLLTFISAHISCFCAFSSFVLLLNVPTSGAEDVR